MSGFSKNDLKTLFRGTFEPFRRDLLCALEAQAAVNVTPFCDLTTTLTVAFQIVTFDPQNPPAVVTWVDATGAPIAGPPANSAQCSETSVNLEHRCWCDVQANSTVVEYVQVFYLDTISGAFVLVANLTSDLSGPYTITGTPTDCCAVGAAAQTIPDYEVLSGIGSWTAPANAVAVSMHVIAAAPASVTLTTTIGTNPMFSGQTVQWDVQGTVYPFINGPITVTTTNAGDSVAITYITIQ